MSARAERAEHCAIVSRAARVPRVSRRPFDDDHGRDDDFDHRPSLSLRRRRPGFGLRLGIGVFAVMCCMLSRALTAGAEPAGATVGDGESLVARGKFPLDVEFVIPDKCLFGGFFVEVVLGYMLPLDGLLSMSLHMGTCDKEFLALLPPKEARFLKKLQQGSRLKTQLRRMNENNEKDYMVVHHGDPCAIEKYTPDTRPARVVARHMTEGWIHADHVKCCNLADAVWVPTEWHSTLFSEAGVDPAKLFVLPESVDTDWYDPAHYALTTVDEGGANEAEGDGGDDGADMDGGGSGDGRGDAAAIDGDGGTGDDTCEGPGSDRFEFLSIFGFGYRKGWDVLLDAYFAEFTPEDDVTLVLRAFKPKHVKGAAVKNNQGWYDMTQKKYNLDIERMPANVTEHVAAYAMETTGKTLSELPRIEWIAETLSKEGMRDLIHRCDSFVLPTRGEGWGLPIVEAMAMEKPVIATGDHSGPTAFMSEENSYPLRSEGVEEQTGFSIPSVEHLRELMRRVYMYSHRDEAEEKGRQARRDIHAQFHPSKVRELLLGRLWGVYGE